MVVWIVSGRQKDLIVSQRDLPVEFEVLSDHPMLFCGNGGVHFKLYGSKDFREVPPTQDTMVDMERLLLTLNTVASSLAMVTCMARNP